ncbi:MAG TPA: radical SAM protein [Tepidisphaeraceae bacterium]|jgi:putative pyruvate formate lyase activating enzyme|nr:radical SAM protein [Tepidisphaeraceae bacterium]
MPTTSAAIVPPHAALAAYRCCNLCEHRCGVDRLAGEVGFCKAGPSARVFRHRVEYGEEIELIPSHLFYLSGCDLRCAFCIAGINAFDPSRGAELTSGFFNSAVEWGIKQGARNIQWVGGEPTIHIPAILNVMAHCPALPPVVWKSDFHGTPEAFAMLKGAVDVYVADLKFGNDRCARRIGGIENYLHIVTRNLIMVSKTTRLIVRHLLLPGHEACCYRPITAWMKKHLPDVPFSLREGYMPSWRSRSFPELAEPLGIAAAQSAREVARQVGLRVIQ